MHILSEWNWKPGLALLLSVGPAQVLLQVEGHVCCQMLFMLTVLMADFHAGRSWQWANTILSHKRRGKQPDHNLLVASPPKP